jgi:Aerotolerance regulator N-terminal/von Willebrand factor type A domain
MFEFLAPIFAIAGAVAASVPIVLHMLRRTPSQKVSFSVVRFLRPTLPKVTKRSTIEHWPLMLLRILALVLIALAFGRPFQNVAATTETSESVSASRIAILIDSSASMRRDGIRESVTRIVDRIADEIQDQDVVSLAVFDRTSRTVITADEWSRSEPDVRISLLHVAVADWEPTWQNTRTGAALLNAAKEVAEERRGSAELTDQRVILITDFQRGSTLDELRTSAFPVGVVVQLEVVEPTQTGNAGVHVTEDDRAGRLRVRVVSSADAQETEFRLQPFDRTGAAVGSPIAVSVSPGQRRSVVLPSADEATQALIAGVELLNDPHPFDNVIDVAITDVPVLKIALIGPANPNDPSTMRYYLQRVIDGNDQDPMELIHVIKPDGVVVPVPDDIKLVFVTSPVPPGLSNSLQSCLDRGGVVFVAADSQDTVASVANLLPTPLTVAEASVRDYAMLGQVDFTHPMFQALSGARFSDLSSIRFWKHRILKVPADSTGWKTVAKFDSGELAIIQADAANGGTIIVSAAGWHPDDSQWALSTRFPPMISSIARMAVPRTSAQLGYVVGQSITPGSITGTDDWTLTDSTGNIVSSSDSGSADESSQNTTFALTEPGRFELTGDSAEETVTYSVIVGLVPSESRTDAFPLGQLQALGLKAKASTASVEQPDSAADVSLIPAEQLRSSELEAKQKLWKWCLLAGLSCLVLESLLASYLERRQTVVTAE